MIWGTLLSLVLGAVPGVIRELAQARVQLAQATTEQQKIEAEERIKALEAKRDVLIAESTSPWNTIARFAVLTPFLVWLWSAVPYDKVFCPWWYGHTCSTDPLSPYLTGIFGLALGFYFVSDISKIWKR